MRRRAGPAIALAAALALSSSFPLGAQDADSLAEESSVPAAGDGEARDPALRPARPAPLSLAPAEKTDDENALLRLAIVSAGAFPVMLFYTDFAFDLGAFVSEGFDAAYAPWPFKSEYSESPTESELLVRIGAAVGVSMTVGAIDYFIRASRAKKARLRRDALLEYSEEERGAGDPARDRPPPPNPAPES